MVGCCLFNVRMRGVYGACAICMLVVFYTCGSDQNSGLRSCVKVEVAGLGSAFLIVLMVSVDVKQQ